MSLPEGTRGQALENLISIWPAQNLEQAERWLAGLVPVQGRDVALGAYAARIRAQFPEMAARWAEEIADDPLRYQKMEDVAESWIESDPKAARNWIAQSSLAETTKARLLGPPSSDR